MIVASSLYGNNNDCNGKLVIHDQRNNLASKLDNFPKELKYIDV